MLNPEMLTFKFVFALKFLTFMLSCLFLGHYALKGILYFDTFFLTNKGQLKFKAVILKSNEPFLNEFSFLNGDSHTFILFP